MQVLGSSNSAASLSSLGSIGSLPQSPHRPVFRFIIPPYGKEPMPPPSPIRPPPSPVGKQNCDPNFTQPGQQSVKKSNKPQSKLQFIRGTLFKKWNKSQCGRSNISDSSQLEQSPLPPRRQTAAYLNLNCANHPQREGKYKAEIDEEEAQSYCTACAKKLVTQGFKVTKVQERSRVETTPFQTKVIQQKDFLRPQLQRSLQQVARQKESLAYCCEQELSRQQLHYETKQAQLKRLFVRRKKQIQGEMNDGMQRLQQLERELESSLRSLASIAGLQVRKADLETIVGRAASVLEQAGEVLSNADEPEQASFSYKSYRR